MWTLLRKAGELDGHAHGRPIVLSDRQVQLVVDEVARRLARAEVAVPVNEAAVRLGLEILTVETLLRRGALTLASVGDDARRRYVCLASIEAFLSAYPLVPAVSPDAKVLPRAYVRELLGEDHNGMGFLVTSRQLIACTRDRKQYITLDSLLTLAEAHGLLSEVLARLAS